MKKLYFFIFFFTFFTLLSCGGDERYGDITLTNSQSDTVFIWHIHYEGVIDEGMTRYKYLYNIAPGSDFVVHYSFQKWGLEVRPNSQHYEAFCLTEGDSLYIYLGETKLTSCGGCLKDKSSDSYDLFNRSIWTKHRVDREETNLSFRF